MKNDQSSAVWFQPAASERASAAGDVVEIEALDR